MELSVKLGMKIFMKAYTDNPDGTQSRHVVISTKEPNTPNGSVKMSFTTLQEDSETEILEKATNALSKQFAVTKSWRKLDHDIWLGECKPVRIN